MSHSLDAVILLCTNPGNQLKYTRIFNELGLYRLTLCSDVGEAKRCVMDGAAFEYFVYDDFNYGIATCEDLLQLHNSARYFILTLSDVESAEFEVLHWARSSKLRLLGLLPRPITAAGVDRMLARRERWAKNGRRQELQCHDA